MKMKEHINKSYLTSCVLPPEGNGEDLLKRNGMDENTDIYFLWGIGAQNFPLLSQMQSISHWGNSECKLTHVSVSFCYPSSCLTDCKIYVYAILVYLSWLTCSQEQTSCSMGVFYCERQTWSQCHSRCFIYSYCKYGGHFQECGNKYFPCYLLAVIWPLAKQ